MKPIIANQEIMLFAGTSFSKREFCQLGSYIKPELNPQIAELEHACWAGMLFEMLPELSPLFAGRKAFIWDIHSTNHFVLITKGTQPQKVENTFSVDPHLFLAATRSN